MRYMVVFSILTVLYKSPLDMVQSNLNNIQYNDFELILVDNSEDEQYFASIVNWIKNLPKEIQLKIKLQRSPKNGGYANGNNLAYKFSIGKYLLLLNPDVKLGDKFLSKAQKILDEKTSWAILSPKVYFDFKRKIIQTTYYTFQKLYPFPLITPGFGLQDDGQYDKYIETFYANGCAMLVRRDLFKKLHGFDENYFMYAEETDLCYRAKLLSFVSVYCPSLMVEHRRGETSSVFADRLIIRNNLYFLGKFFTLKILVIQYLFSLIRIIAMVRDKTRITYAKIIPLFKAMNEGLVMGIKGRSISKILND